MKFIVPAATCHLKQMRTEKMSGLVWILTVNMFRLLVFLKDFFFKSVDAKSSSMQRVNILLIVYPHGIDYSNVWFILRK